MTGCHLGLVFLDFYFNFYISGLFLNNCQYIILIYISILNFHGSHGRGPPPQFNPILPPNPNFLPPHLNQFLPNPRIPPNFPFQNPNFRLPNPGFPVLRPDVPVVNPNEVLERVDRAVKKARADLVAAGDSVSTWKVRQAALVILKIDSWDSFGFQMQEVPSLYRLMVTEGKINAFIHCFVGVRKITSLHDLELAICKNEGVAKFEELDLGPILRHPLVVQYFGASPNVKDVFKITSEEIISFISKLIRKKKQKEITADELLDYIAKKKSVDKKELLSVRIRSLLPVSSLKKELDEHIGLKSEPENLGDGNTILGEKRRKHSVPSPQKKKLDEHIGVISEQVSSFTSRHKDISEKHIRFTSSEDDGDTSNNNKGNGNESVPQNSCSSPSQIVKFDCSSCPFPSLDEEIKRLRSKGKAGPIPSPASKTLTHNGQDRPLKRKRISEDLSTGTPSSQMLKRDEIEAHGLSNKKLLSKDKKEQSFLRRINEGDLARDVDTLRTFICIWKEACMENKLTQVLDMMIEFYQTRNGDRVKEIFSQKPFAELLNVADKVLTGRIGELVAFRYFLGKFGGTCVKWVNETFESGFPYDIAVGNEEMGREYIEVKATKSDRKDWFNLTAKEWQFAVEKGECYSIARVTLQSNDMAKITIYKNPVRLCQLGQLQKFQFHPDITLCRHRTPKSCLKKNLKHIFNQLFLFLTQHH
ncbi:hypothetical protein DCAR_0935788 [Daucus carota subsp. sativus]|uniref:Protein NO VEIN C-terminal domain-containing protein n=1 Tax=Daucus carota subsp. sativus TaxID=79200 RepID=A0AAF1BFT8_DAUCS|nr:hypothetical protein DCAR_0935788 [Daucus carota subsp. sativus]